LDWIDESTYTGKAVKVENKIGNHRYTYIA
jgi:hypothetical protein